MKCRVRLEWLRVLDELRAASERQPYLALERVMNIATRCGLPQEGVSLEHEVSSMLCFFHGFNAVLWFDEPVLREMVVLDVQWVVDAVTCIIRDYALDDHTTKYSVLHSTVLHCTALHCAVLGWAVLYLYYSYTHNYAHNYHYSYNYIICILFYAILHLY